MFYRELEEELRGVGRAFQVAGSEDIVELGEQYLARLEEYLTKLYEHPAAPGRNTLPSPSSSYEAVSSMREAVRGEIERTAAERDRVSALLSSFTEIRVGDAVETLNAHGYKGRVTWRLRAGVVTDGGRESMSLQQAVDAAGLLRREAYVSRGGHTKSASGQGRE